MNWTAIVPIKPTGLGKTRLAGLLGPDQRARLGERMRDHVLAVLGGIPNLEVRLLCPSPPADWAGHWIADTGRGLNAEIRSAARTVSSRLLVVHADLPMLQADDIKALLGAAKNGIAIAPDRHGTGTNALALADPRALRFVFGPDSFARHRRQAPDAIVIDRPGLAHDLDTPDDLAVLLGSGPIDSAMRDAIAA